MRQNSVSHFQVLRFGNYEEREKLCACVCVYVCACVHALEGEKMCKDAPPLK